MRKFGKISLPKTFFVGLVDQSFLSGFGSVLVNTPQDPSPPQKYVKVKVLHRSEGLRGMVLLKIVNKQKFLLIKDSGT